MADEQAHLSEEAVTALSSRLANEPLTLPRSAGEAPDAAKKREYLNCLLRRDPGVFLERHCVALNSQERAYFQPLRGNYDVNFYMQQLEDADNSANGATVRNRRLAWLNRQDANGEYFSEEAMRKRAPALHELYMGSSAPMPEDQAGGNDTFDRLEREAVLHEQRIADIKRARQEQEVGEEEEEEEEEEDGAERPTPAPVQEAAGTAPHGHARDESLPESTAGAAAGGEGSAQDFDMLLSVMKARFLSGQDGAFVDYKAVDADASLDDDWAAVANQDAQERYFDAD